MSRPAPDAARCYTRPERVERMAGRPIVLRAHALDALDAFHDTIRKRRNLREQPMEFDHHELWEREARRRFGPNKLGWKFLCHHCKTIFSVADYVAARAPQQAIGFACLGAFVKDERLACNYNGKNAQPANPVLIHLPGGASSRMLAFAD